MNKFKTLLISALCLLPAGLVLANVPACGHYNCSFWEDPVYIRSLISFGVLVIPSFLITFIIWKLILKNIFKNNKFFGYVISVVIFLLFCVIIDGLIGNIYIGKLGFYY